MKLKKLLFCLVLCAVFCCLASCGTSNKAFEQAEKNGCTIRLTYDFGNGNVQGNNEMLYCLPPDALAPELGEVVGTQAPMLLGYHLTGYYVKEENGNERDWDFTKDRVTEDITLYARWEKDVVVQTYAVQIFYGDNNEQSYTLSSFTAENPTLAAFRRQDWEGHTFYGFYYDEDYTQPVSFPYTHQLNEGEPEKVYAKYLDMVCTIIRTPADFGGRIDAGGRYYLDNDIDMSGVTVTVTSADFVGAFYGNGHVLSGLSVTRNQERRVAGYGLFNTISSGAEFHDITFAGISVNVVLDNAQNTMINYVGGFAGIVNAGVTFENVSVTGVLAYDEQRTFEEGNLTVEPSIGECDPGVSLEGFSAAITVTKLNDQPES